MNNNHFMGFQTIYFFGVVEDRMDPLNVGRVRVRIYAFNSDLKHELPTEQLIWAQILIPTNDETVKPPREGQIVFGIFMDGEAAQFPLILGTIPHIPDTQTNPNKGFADPRTSSDLTSAPRPPESVTYNNTGSGVNITEASQAQRYPSILNEPTTSRIARNENISQTLIGQINSNLTTGIDKADGTTWDEPKSSYAAKYPYDNVIESESGHVIEIDDTPGAERLFRGHRSGTYEEFKPSGDRACKVVGTNYHIIMEGDNVYIMGDCNLTINGKRNVKIGGDCNMQIGGDYTIDVTGIFSLTADGITFNAKGKKTTINNTGEIDIIGNPVNINQG